MEWECVDVEGVGAELGVETTRGRVREHGMSLKGSYLGEITGDFLR